MVDSTLILDEREARKVIVSFSNWDATHDGGRTKFKAVYAEITGSMVNFCLDDGEVRLYPLSDIDSIVVKPSK